MGTKPKLPDDPLREKRLLDLSELDKQLDGHLANFKRKDMDKFLDQLKAKRNLLRQVTLAEKARPKPKFTSASVSGKVSEKIILHKHTDTFARLSQVVGSKSLMQLHE
jgi:hypothetical protein